jgi:hypothetical protein
MKKIFVIIVAALFVANVWAQSPQKMSYQLVIRDANAKLVSPKPLKQGALTKLR